MPRNMVRRAPDILSCVFAGAAPRADGPHSGGRAEVRRGQQRPAALQPQGGHLHRHRDHDGEAPVLCVHFSQNVALL
jgi:hypothetical protein